MTMTRHHQPGSAGASCSFETPELGFLEESAVRSPYETAVDYYGCKTSYRTLHGAALNLAGYMQQRLGVRQGDRVLLLMQSCPQFMVAFHAITRCGAVVMALSPMSTPEEIDRCASDSGARVLIGMQDTQAHVEPLLAKGRLAGCIIGAYSEMAGRPEDVPFMQIPAFVLEPRRLSPGFEEGIGLHDFAGAIAAGIEPAAISVSACSQSMEIS